MVLPAAASAAQQAYTTPIQQRQENLVRNPEQRPEDSEQQPLPVSDKPPVENIEASAKDDIAKKNADTAANQPQIGDARSETLERGSLIDLSA